MTRRAARRFGLAAVAFALAAWIGFGRAPDRLDRAEAGVLAAQLFAAYTRAAGETAAHFAARPTIGYPDGWEFSWTYSPCPEVTALRVFVGRNGSAAYSQTPDCAAPDDVARPLTRA